MDVIAILRGLVLNPRLVAFARGLVEAAVMGALVIAGDMLVSGDGIPDEYRFLVPIATLVIRFMEGHADAIDPSKQRRRDALRESAAQAEVTNGASGPLDPGDVKDPAVDAAIEAYNRGDLT